MADNETGNGNEQNKEATSNGNGSTLRLIVGGVLGSAFLIFGFIAVLIIWGGVDPQLLLQYFGPVLLLGFGLLWKSFQDRENARKLREDEKARVAREVATEAARVERDKETTRLLEAARVESARLLEAAREEIREQAKQTAALDTKMGRVVEIQVDMQGALDGMTTKRVEDAVGKEKAEGERDAAVLAAKTAEELAEAIAAPAPGATLDSPEVQPVEVVNTVVPVEVVEKPEKGK